MRIGFLDVDGVLNQRGTKERYHGVIGIDPRNVATLNEILDKSESLFGERPKLVISSTWRKNFSMEGLVKLFAGNGVRGEVIGRTGSHPTGMRGFEIQEWLEHHAPRDLSTGELLVEGIVILDDGTDMIHLMHKLVQTSCFRGLRGKHVPRALKKISEPLLASNRARIKWEHRGECLRLEDVNPIDDSRAQRFMEMMQALRIPEREEQ